MLHLLKTTVKIKKKYKFVPGKPFNPNFDGNLLAWYDGDTLNTDPANTWSDSSANGYNLTLFNNPTIVNNAINGHDALQFDGISQYGQSGAFARTQPTTVYIVFKLVVEVAGKRIFDGLSADSNILWVQVVNGLSVYAGNNILDHPITTTVYQIRTCVYNGANSVIRLNDNAAINGNAGTNNASGLIIGKGAGSGTFSNSEIAYLIIRDVADNTAIQDIFINYLKNRFAL